MIDLKEVNEKPLTWRLLVALVPIYVSLAVIHGDRLLEIAGSQPRLALLQLAAIGVTPLLCLKVLLSLLPNLAATRWKERLAHFRWHDPLPGGRCHKLLNGDARISQDDLPPAVEALKEESLTPGERNARWYRDVYLPVRMDPAVSNTHRQYLLYRDASAGTLLLFMVSAFSDIASRVTWGMPVLHWFAYLALLAYLLALIFNANAAGNRMVTGAIANFSNHHGSRGNP